MDPRALSDVPVLVQWRCVIQALQSGGAQARGVPIGGGGEVGQAGGKKPRFSGCAPCEGSTLGIKGLSLEMERTLLRAAKPCVVSRFRSNGVRAKRSQFGGGDAEGGGAGSTAIGVTGMSVLLCWVLVSGTCRPATEEAGGPTAKAEGPTTGGGEGAGAGAWRQQGAEVLTNWLLRLQEALIVRLVLS